MVSPDQDGPVLLQNVARGVGVRVVVLDQQPFVGAATRRAYQGPRAPELAPAECKRQLAVRQALSHLRLGRLAVSKRDQPALVGRVDPGVPDDDLPGAVLAFADDPLERAVVRRMVLHHNGQALFVRVQRRPSGDRPGREYAVGLQAEVVVDSPRRVLLHDAPERTAPGSTIAGRRLRGGVEIAFSLVAFEHGGQQMPL